jgi:glycosyltransferase involved in cell wall biosynthesis
MLPVYNIDLIIKAIPKVIRHFPNCRFLFLFAHADNLNKAKALADSLKVTNSAMFIGLASYDQMPFYYASSDVCVSVPSSDSSPCSVYEAMACGIPVVISNLPWTKHFMKDRQNALIVQTDPEAIADAVTEILKNELLRGTLVTNGLSTVKEYVDYHKNMEVMEKLMLHIIRRNTC